MKFLFSFSIFKENIKIIDIVCEENTANTTSHNEKAFKITKQEYLLFLGVLEILNIVNI